MIEAAMNRPEAISSCSPLGPLTGKCGESTQMRIGTVAIRLSVMEFGRFTGVLVFRAVAQGLVVAGYLPFCHKRAARRCFVQHTAGVTFGTLQGRY